MQRCIWVVRFESRHVPGLISNVATTASMRQMASEGQGRQKLAGVLELSRYEPSWQTQASEDTEPVANVVDEYGQGKHSPLDTVALNLLSRKGGTERERIGTTDARIFVTQTSADGLEGSLTQQRTVHTRGSH